MNDENSSPTLTVEMSALAYGGACIGTIVAPEGPYVGKKAFVRETIPGEKAEISLQEDKKSFVLGSLRAIQQRSPDRAAPPCPKFGLCGGCDLQHVELTAQREMKREMVRTAIERHVGPLPKDGITLLGQSLPGLHYRRRIALHLDTAGRLGFYRQGTGDVVDINYCYLASEQINSGLKELGPILRTHAEHLGGVVIDQHGEALHVILKLREGSRADAASLQRISDSLCIPFLKILDRDRVVYSRPRETVVPSGHFSQINEAANSLLVAAVIENVQEERVTDLYAGSGNFSLPLARLKKQVDAVEADPLLVSYGEMLAKDAALSGSLRFHLMSCERYVKSNELAPLVILDPPRSGAKTIVPALLAHDCRRVIYVSCNLPSLTTDLKNLSQGGFRISKLSVLDMFSQTHHIEVIAVLDRPTKSQ